MATASKNRSYRSCKTPAGAPVGITQVAAIAAMVGRLRHLRRPHSSLMVRGWQRRQGSWWEVLFVVSIQECCTSPTFLPLLLPLANLTSFPHFRHLVAKNGRHPTEWLHLTRIHIHIRHEDQITGLPQDLKVDERIQGISKWTWDFQVAHKRTDLGGIG